MDNVIKIRVYPAEVVEKMIDALKNDYLVYMNKCIDEGKKESVDHMAGAIVGLGALEDRLFKMDPQFMELK